MDVRRTSLDGDWALAWAEADLGFQTVADDLGSPDRVPARVPGNVELDLVRAGLLPDPFFGMNAADLVALEGRHWWLTRRFVSEPGEGEDFLCFDGIDCHAEVFLNGERVLTTDNALVEHEVQVRLLGQNELVVHLIPAREVAGRELPPIGCSAQAQSMEGLRVRKPAHAYGWDIMPRIVTAGLWRSVRLERRPPLRFAQTFLRTVEADADSARMVFHYQLAPEAAGRRDLRVRLAGRCGDSVFEAEAPVLWIAGKFGVRVKRPRRWWPKGRGQQDLYDVEASLIAGGEVVFTERFRHGIRTVELVRTETTDSEGSGDFHFLVNHEPVFILGTNWVPLDAFHSRDAERLPAAMALLDEVGCNLVRCWGGNVYESDAFFDHCDEQGILVWQDFAMACARYPQDDAFAAAIEAEARKVVRRLRRHACVAMWAGDNECDEAHLWSDLGDPNRNRLTREALPRVLDDEDPGRPYLPSSPFLGPGAFALGSRYAPETHLWGPRNSFRSDYYDGTLAHFASEIGYHGSPSVESIRRFISPDKVWPPGNDEWLLHATSPIPGAGLCDYRIALMSTQIRALFGEVPADLGTWVAASQATQAEALKHFIEWFRMGKWRRTGIVWWNLLDGWPQFSDAVVDYFLDRKPAFEFARRAQRPLLLAVRSAAGGYELVACNDRREPSTGRFVILDEVGGIVMEGPFEAAGDASSVLAYFDLPGPTFLKLEWSTEGEDGTNHFLAGPGPWDFGFYRDRLAHIYPSASFSDVH